MLVLVAHGGWIGCSLALTLLLLAKIVGLRGWASDAPWASEMLRAAVRAPSTGRAAPGARAWVIGRVRARGDACVSPGDGASCAAFDVDCGEHHQRARADELDVRGVTLRGEVQLDAALRESVGAPSEQTSERLAALGIAAAKRTRIAALSSGELALVLGRTHAVTSSGAATYRATKRRALLDGDASDPIRILGVRATLRTMARAVRAPLAWAWLVVTVTLGVLPIAPLRLAPPETATPDAARELGERFWLPLLSPVWRGVALAQLEDAMDGNLTSALTREREHRARESEIALLLDIGAALRVASPSCAREALIAQLGPDARDGAHDACDAAVVAVLAHVLAEEPPTDLEEHLALWRSLLASAERSTDDGTGQLELAARNADVSPELEASIAGVALHLAPQRPWVRAFLARMLARLALLSAIGDPPLRDQLREAVRTLDTDQRLTRVLAALLDPSSADSRASTEEIEATTRALTLGVCADEPVRSRMSWEFGIVSQIERGVPGERGADPDPRLYPELRARASHYAGTDVMVLGAEARLLAHTLGRQDVVRGITIAMGRFSEQQRGVWADGLRAPIAAFLGQDVTPDATPTEVLGAPTPISLPAFETVDTLRPLCGDPLDAIARDAWVDLPLCDAPGTTLAYLRGRYIPQYWFGPGAPADIVMVVTSEPHAPYRECGLRTLDVRYLIDSHADMIGYTYAPSTDGDARALLRAQVFDGGFLSRGPDDGIASVCFDEACREALAASIHDPELARMTQGAPVGISGTGLAMHVRAIEPVRNPADPADPEPVGVHLIDGHFEDGRARADGAELTSAASARRPSAYGRPLAAGEVPGTLRLAGGAAGIEIDGRCLTVDPYYGFPVAPGTHTIHTIDRYTGASRTFTVDVAPGRTVTHSTDGER